MHITNISEATAHLSQLIARVLAGDEIVIAKANEPLVKLIPYEQETSPRTGGFWEGQIEYRASVEAMDREVEDLFTAFEPVRRDRQRDYFQSPQCTVAELPAFHSPFGFDGRFRNSGFCPTHPLFENALVSLGLAVPDGENVI